MKTIKFVRIFLLILIIIGVILLITQSMWVPKLVDRILAAESVPVIVQPTSGAGFGERCGGNMTTARSCASGLHCAPAPGSHLPFGDVGGTCVAD